MLALFRPWLILVGSFLLYCSVILASIFNGTGLTAAIRDLGQTCGLSVFVGSVSNLGYLIFCSSAAIPLFASLTSTFSVRSQNKSLLLSGGIFSAWLTLDDMFLIHDRYVNQEVLYVIYAAFAVYLLIRHRITIQKTGGSLIFLASVTLMGLSIVTDKFQRVLGSLFSLSYQEVQFFEEGLKFMGQSYWLYFWCIASAFAINTSLKEAFLRHTDSD